MGVMAGSPVNIENAAEALPPSSAPDRRSEVPSPLSAMPAAVYGTVARSCLPRLCHILGSAPWLDDESYRRAGLRNDSELWCRRPAATQAIGMLVDNDPELADNAYLRECVRASLVRWQMSLTRDGRPRRRAARRAPLYPAGSAHVIHLLADSSEFQTELLLRDLIGHTRWLARQPQQTPWLEATTVGALVDGAVVIRDTTVLKTARDRLGRLLARQDEEGWFPEHGGADLGRLSLAVDALARLFRRTGWEELLPAIKQAMAFMTHFAHPDGSFGGCYGSEGTAFISPYGPELMATTLREAASLAALTRQRYARYGAGHLPPWHDDLLSLMAPRLILAALAAPQSLPAQDVLPFEKDGQVFFPNAGLVIRTTRDYHAVVGLKSGGALHATWRNGKSALEEPGVKVVFPFAVRTANRWDRRVDVRVGGDSVTAHGILRRPLREPRKRWAPLRSFLRQHDSASREIRGEYPTWEKRWQPADYLRLTHDWYRREITFTADTICLRDAVRCRLPCQAVICRTPLSGDISRLADRDPAPSAPAPIFTDGGRFVEVIRSYRNGQVVD